MSLFGLLNHLINLLLPALVVGALVAVLAPWVVGKARSPHGVLKQCAINTAVCAVVVLVGLVVFGRDGKMLTYAAMVLACASSQWFAAKAWRK
jgi:hypothetical protein